MHLSRKFQIIVKTFVTPSICVIGRTFDFYHWTDITRLHGWIASGPRRKKCQISTLSRTRNRHNVAQQGLSCLLIEDFYKHLRNVREFIRARRHVYTRLRNNLYTFLSIKLWAYETIVIASHYLRTCAVIGHDRTRNDNIRNTHLQWRIQEKRNVFIIFLSIRWNYNKGSIFTSRIVTSVFVATDYHVSSWEARNREHLRCS